jgi:hypothetical protein
VPLTRRPGQKEPEPRNRTEITENRNRTERTDIKFGSGFLRTKINELFSVLHPKEPKNPKKPKVKSPTSKSRPGPRPSPKPNEPYAHSSQQVSSHSPTPIGGSAPSPPSSAAPPRSQTRSQFQTPTAAPSVRPHPGTQPAGARLSVLRQPPSTGEAPSPQAPAAPAATATAAHAQPATATAATPPGHRDTARAQPPRHPLPPATLSSL